jgi:peptidoglycan hydrolase-like protein with peptidoglycan-binding domain
MSGSMDTQTVRQVQQALSNKGHDPGPVDGIMGPRTRAAVEAYQRSQNLSSSSGLDQRTLDSLGVQASASGMSSANPRGSGAGSTDSSSSAGGSGAVTGGSGGMTDPSRGSNGTTGSDMGSSSTR